MVSWTLKIADRSFTLTNETSGVGVMEDPEIVTFVEGNQYPVPRSDGVRFGRMRRRGQQIVFKVSVLPDSRPLDDVWRELKNVWRADEIRNNPGVLASLTAPSGLQVFGLPRELEESYEHRVVGIIRAQLVFECVDDLWYGVEQSNDLTFVPASGGGLIFPAEAPFVFHSGPQVRNGAVHVDGDVDCWPVFEIHGQVTDPVIEVAGVGSLVFKVGLAYDQVLTVDTRPWVRSVLRDGAPLPGALSASGDRLSDMALKPGAHTILLKGLDPSGTSMLRVKVTPAFTSF